MNDIPAVIPWGAALTALSTVFGVATKAFFQALKATAEVSAEKNRTIDRLAKDADELRRRLAVQEDEARADLVAARSETLRVQSELVAKDIMISELRGQLRRLDPTHEQ